MVLVIAILALIGCSTVVPSGQTPNIPEGSDPSSFGRGVVEAIKKYATVEQQAAYLEKAGAGSLLIPVAISDATIPGKTMPTSWLSIAPTSETVPYSATAYAGDFKVFQLAFINGGQATTVTDFSVAEGDNPVSLGAAVNCFTLGGIGSDGLEFSKTVNVAANQSKPFWFGLQTGENWPLGDYTFSLALNTGEKAFIKLSLIEGKSEGEDDSRSLARLKWLDSRIAATNEPTAPFTPVVESGNEISILGRKMVKAGNGLYSQIYTYFNESNTQILSEGQEILATPFNIEASTKNGQTINLNSKNWKLERTVDFDGYNGFKLKLTADKDLELDSVKLTYAITEPFSKYVMGIDLQGQKTPDAYDWKWDVKKHQDALWVGGVNGGLMVRLKDENYERPLINAYYDFKPILEPKSWGNGGISFKRQSDGSLAICAYSGAHQLKAGESLNFNFDLYVTPFKPLEQDKQWNDRYLHFNPGSRPDTPDLKMARRVGANVMNIHHNRDLNPFINYPYNDYTMDDLTDFIAEAHAEGRRVKSYYTTREVTNNMHEFFMLYSLDGEIMMPRKEGVGWPVTNWAGPHPWLTANLGEDFVPAWRETLRGRLAGMLDLAVITTPLSRWNNFYLEGLDYLIEKTNIDGIYIDDTALDRQSMARARRIIDARRPEGRIDMHSWNHYNNLAGWASNSVVFMELYPYYDKLWHGEGFDYENTSAEYWLVEMSGIPFGLMSEMLQNGGNQWRGLVFGETNRYGWHMPPGQPMNVWKVLDQFGMKGSQMIGWWDADNPVDTGNEDIKATVYVKEGKTFLAIASWAKGTQTVSLDIDFEALGLNKDSVKVTKPSVSGFQFGSNMKKSASLLNSVKVSPNKGVVYILEG